MNNLIDAISAHKEATEALNKHATEMGLDEHSLLELSKHQGKGIIKGLKNKFKGLKKKFASLGKSFVALVVKAAKKLWKMAKTLAKIIYKVSDYLYLGLGAEGVLIPPHVTPVIQICFAAEKYLIHAGEGFGKFATGETDDKAAHFLEVAERAGAAPIAEADVAQTDSELDSVAAKPEDLPDNTEKGVQTKENIFSKLLTSAGNKVTKMKNGAKKIFQDLGNYAKKCDGPHKPIEAKVCVDIAGHHVAIVTSLNMNFIDCIMADLKAGHKAQDPVVKEEDKAAFDKAASDQMTAEEKQAMEYLGFKGVSDIVNLIGNDAANGIGRAFFGALGWVGHTAAKLMGIKKGGGHGHGEGHAASLIELQEHGKKIRGLSRLHGGHTCYDSMMAGVQIFPFPVVGGIGIEYSIPTCAKEGNGVVPLVKTIGRTIVDFFTKKEGGKEEEDGSDEQREHEEMKLVYKNVHDAEAGSTKTVETNPACAKLNAYHVIEAKLVPPGVMTSAHVGPLKPAVKCVAVAVKDMVKGLFKRQGLCKKAKEDDGCKSEGDECLKDADCGDGSCEGGASWRNLKGKCVPKAAIAAGAVCEHDFQCKSTHCSKCRVNCKGGAFGVKQGVCRMKKKHADSRKGVVGSRCQKSSECKCPGCKCQGEVRFVSDGACSPDY